MKKLLLNLVAVLVAAKGLAQKPFKQVSDTERVYIEAGMLYPLDNLKHVMKPSVNFGFWFKVQADANESYEIGFNLTVPKANESFDYVKEDSVFRNRARGLTGMVGFRYARTYPLSAADKRINVEVFPSLGFAFFTHKSTFLYTDGLENEPGNHERHSPIWGTFHIGQGVRLNYKNVGLQVQYQFTPYSLFYDYAGSIGSQALTFGIVYKQ